jgi:peptidoglycan/xylan/chitin deacetylase (PgdA/CDA1 family)
MSKTQDIPRSLRAAGPLAFILWAAGCAAHKPEVVADSRPNGASSAPATRVAGRSLAPSGLPIPPTAGVPRPSGAPHNLTVLDWAGFKSAVSFTFDDSQPSHIEHYAELQAVGVPMTFYINAGHNDLADFDATWTRAAKDGHELGNHTAHHCRADLTGCGVGGALADAAAEIDANITYITGHYPQRAVWTMASPYGDNGWSRPSQASHFINRGVVGGTIAPGDAADPFNLPVHMAATGETAARFNAATDGARAAGRWLIFVIHTISPTTANWYNPVDIGAVTAGMSYPKSLGDVWIDTVASVGAYWRGQKALAAATPVVSGDRTTWTWTLPPHFPAGTFLRVKVDGGTLTQGQGGAPLAWSDHGYYEVALDAGTLTLAP